MTSNQDGKLCVAVGSSRSGKTAYVKQQIKRFKRVIVFDIKEEYSDGFLVVTAPDHLVALLKKYKHRNMRISYRPTLALKVEFNFWAKAAYAWALVKPVAIVAEELADVTSPNKAPEGWGMLLRKVLCTGSDVYAITQRPAESDKTCMGNATYFHCGRLARFNDRKYMANEMDVLVEEISALKPLEYIQRWDDGRIERGKLKF